MSKNLEEELKVFLKNAKLSTYEINTFLTLLFSSNLTAKEISQKANVPSGRIYEVLEVLSKKGMIEIQDSRPKMYKSLTFNSAFQNLISYKEDERKRENAFLINQAKSIESKLYTSDMHIKKDSSKQFWSTAFGSNSIFSLYIKHSHELKKELLFTGFLNENTLKILKHAKVLYDVIHKVIDKGIRVKYLWSLDYDDRPLSAEEKEHSHELYKELIIKCEEYFDISPDIKEFESKYIYKRFQTYYDIFDGKRIIFKLRNPFKQFEIYACMNVLDPELAEELRRRYLNIWEFEAIR